MTESLITTPSLREKHVAYANGEKFFITFAVSLITLFLSILVGVDEMEFKFRDVSDIIIAILFFWLVWTLVTVLICCTYLKLHFGLSVLIGLLHPFMACFAMYCINAERAGNGGFEFNYLILLALHMIVLIIWFVVYGIVWLIKRPSSGTTKNTHKKQIQEHQAAPLHSQSGSQRDPYAELIQSMENEKNNKEK